MSKIFLFKCRTGGGISDRALACQKAERCKTPVLLLDEKHPLHNRTLHISGTFKVPEKANIEEQKANIEEQKANIGDSFTERTASNICKLLETFGFQAIFGRADVQNVLGLKPTRSTELLGEMTEKGLIEPVTGLGKGKYRFRNQQG